MPRNKKESVIFTLMMCGLMVLGMSTYNIIGHTGINSNLIPNIAIGFLPTFTIALIFDVLFVNKIAKKATFKLPINKDKRWQIILAISGFTIIQMVPLMSFYGSIISPTSDQNFLAVYLHTILANLAMAVPLQFLIVGPISRKVLSKIQSN